MAKLDVEVTKLKDIRGRRIKGYRARVYTNTGASQAYADGQTEQESVDNLRAKLTLTLNHLQMSPTVFHYKGFTAIVFCCDIFPDSKGFAQYGSRLVWPDGRVGCECIGGTRKSVTDAAQCHIAQNLYAEGIRTPEGLFTSNEAQESYESWAQWQDRYKELRAAGHSDTEAHAMVSGINVAFKDGQVQYSR